MNPIKFIFLWIGKAVMDIVDRFASPVEDSEDLTKEWEELKKKGEKSQEAKEITTRS